MAYTTIKELFTAICDAIRAKTGTTDLINHQDIPARISSIETGTGLDTSDANATPQDMGKDSTAYVNGEKITGVASVFTSEVGYSDRVPTVVGESVSLKSPAAGTNGWLFKAGSKFWLNSPLSNFGDAEDKDVRAGKQYTSVAGLLRTGTADMDGTGGGKTIKTGTATSATIETGLSSIDVLVLYKESVAETGLVNAIYSALERKSTYTRCASYSTYTKQYAVATGDTVASVSGGTFTWGGESTSAMSSGITYKWIAVGAE